MGSFLVYVCISHDIMRLDNVNVLWKGNNMKKLWNSIGAPLRHNVPLVAGILLCAVILYWGVGCESEVVSLTQPNRKVNRVELRLELDAEIAKLEQAVTDLYANAELKVANLNKQDQVKETLFKAGMIVAEGGTVNPVGIATTLAGILGISAVVNSREKDKIIAGKRMA